MELTSLIFKSETSELERASTVIAALVQDMTRVSAASANMARIQAQTEAILARAATESAKARKENARAADIEIKTIIAADKADADRAESIRKAAEAERRRTEATEESTRASSRNVTILQRQSDILEFQAQGWSKGQSSILATAKAANIAADEMEKLQKVLETQRKLMGSDPFDKSMSGLTSLKNQYGELRESIRQYNTDSDLTSKQTKELARDKERLIEKMKTENASFSEIRAAVRAHNDEYVKLAGQYNTLSTAEANVIKNRKAVASATDYLTQADQKLVAALNTSNAAIDRSGTDLLVKYESALRKSGVSQDIATQKLAEYKAQLIQVQGQENKRREDHLARSLAPQATDIAVSLWSGQNPLTVLLQQSGQINDLFMQSGVAAEDFAKTVRNSLTSMVPSIITVATGISEVIGGMFMDAGKSVLDFISDVSGISAAVEAAQRWLVSAGEANFRWIGVMQRFGENATKVMVVGILAVVTAMVAMVMKYKEIIQSENELSKALALNGGAMDMTKESAIEYANSMKQVGIGNLKAQESMTAFINAGAVGAETMDAAREAAVALEKYAGVALSDTAKEFAKLQDEPSKVLIEIAKNTGQVEKATLDVISAIEKEQGASAAAAAATVYAAEAKKKAADEIKASLSPIETLWRDIKSAVGQAGQAVYDLATSNKVVDTMRIAWQTVAVIISETWFVIKGVGKEIGGIAAQLVAVLSGDFAGAASIGESMREDAQAARAEHDKLITSIMTKGAVEKEQFNENKAQNSEYAEWLEKNSKALAKSHSKEEQFAIKKKQLQEDLKKDLIDEVKYNEALAGWKRVIMGEDKKPKAAPKDTFYDTSMTKFRDASIAATDATKELTKSQLELMQTVADPKFAKLSEQKKLDILQSGAAAIAKEQEKEATIALVKAEEFREKVLGKSEGLGKQYYADIEALYKHAKATEWSTEQIDEMIVKIYKGTPVYQAYQKTIDRVTEALHKFSEASIAYQSSTNAENQELDYRISLLGRTAEEQRKLQIEYQRETKINATRVELEKKLRDIAKERAQAEKDGVVGDKIKELTDAEVQARQDAAERIKVINKGIAVEYASDLDKEIAAIRGGISDSIVTALFEGGKEGSKKLRSVLVDALRKKVTIVVDAVVNTLMGNVIGGLVGGAGGSAAGGVASSIGSSAVGGLASNALGTLGAFGGAVQGFGTAALAATQSMLGMTGTVAQMSTSLAAAGHTAAAGMQSGIAAFQAIPGWGWALAGVALLAGSGIGSTRGANHGGGLYSSLGQTNQEAASQLTGKLGWKDPEEDFTKRGNTELNKQVESTVKGLLELYNGLGKLASGTVKELEVVAGFATNSKYDDEESYGYFQILEKATGELLKEYTNRDMEKDGGKAWEQYVADLGTAMVTELRASDIPSWMDEILKELGDAPTLESFQKAVTEIHKIDQAFSTFSKTIDGFAGMTDKSFEALMKASGGTDALAQSLNSYYENFYTEEERMVKATASLTEELAKSGVVIPTTKDAYRKMVTAALEAGESGTELAAKLIQLSPAFAGITPAAVTASKQLATLNKIISNFGLKTNLKDVNFTDATKTLFESFGVAVEDYSNSISGVLDGILTGKVKAEDAGKSLAEAAVGGITGAIAKAGADAIAAQFVMSVITPILDNIRSGKAALDGVDVQGGVAKAKQDAVDLKIVLNTLGIDIGNGLIGLADGIVAAGNTATQMINGGASTVTPTVGTNQYGGVGDSHFTIGGSAVNNPYQSPEAQSLTELTNQTLNSNLKVSELLQKLLNPEKLFENKYKALDDQLIQQRKELSRTNVGGGLGVNESTIQADIDALRLKIADNTSVHSIIDPMMRALDRISNYATPNDLKTADSVFGDIAKLIVERSEGTPSTLGGYSINGTAGDPIQKRIQDTIKEYFNSAVGEGKLDWFNEFINGALGITSSSFNDNLDLQAKITQMAELETKLREWYIAQARVIAVEDMSALATETTAAKAKTEELKRTGGLEDPVTKLKDQLAQKMQAIDEGIGKALLAEVEVLKSQKVPDSITKPIQAEIDKSKKLLADFISAPETLLNSLQSEYTELSGTPTDVQNTNYVRNRMKELRKEIQAIQSGTFAADLGVDIAGLEDKMIAALLAATDPAKQEALLAEIAKYKGGITEWYKAQADLLSTEMLIDINKQIKGLETSEKGPLTAIKDAIQKYIDDFKALGTLTDDVQTQIDKLSGLQLTKARKSLYDQLLTPEEVKTRDKTELTKQFENVGKVVPASTSALREMIDAAQALGNSTLADKLLELVPAFVALQDAATSIPSAEDLIKTFTDAYRSQLGRAPDTAGLEYWVSVVQSGTMTLEKAMEAFGEGATTEGLNNRVLELTDAEGYLTLMRQNELSLLSSTNKAIKERIYALEDEAAASAFSAGISKTKADADIRLLQAQGNAAEVERLQREQYIAGLTGLTEVQRIASIGAYDYTQLIDNQIEAIQRTTQVQQEKLGLESSILQLLGKTTEMREIELSKLDESNRPLQERIWLLEDEKRISEERKGLQDQLNQVTLTNVELRSLELATLNEVNRPLQERIWALEDEAKAIAFASEISKTKADADIRLLQAQGNAVTVYALEREQYILGLNDLTEVQRAASIGAYDYTKAIEKQINAMTAAKTIAGLDKEVSQLSISDLEKELAGISDRAGEYLRGLQEIDQATASNIASVNAWEQAMTDAAKRASTLATVSKATDDAYSALERAMDAQRTGINKDLEIVQQRIGLENTLLGLLGNTTELRKRELSGIDESNRSVQERIWSLQDAASATDTAFETLERSVNLQKQVVQETVDNIKAIFDSAKDAVKSLYNEVDTTRKANVFTSMQFIDSTLDNARRGGQLPESTALREAIDAVQGSIVDEQYSSAFEAERARLVLAGKLSEIRDIAEPQLTSAESQLKALDAILSDGRKQIDALRGVNDAVLTTSEAHRLLQVTLSSEVALREQAAFEISQSNAVTQQELLKEQLRVLEETLVTAKARIEELRGVDTSILSLTTAVSALATAIADEMNSRPTTAAASIMSEGSMSFAANNVIPLSLTPTASNVVQPDNSEIIEENRLLRQELQAQNGAMVRLLSKVAKVVERWDDDGMPEVRTTT